MTPTSATAQKRATGSCGQPGPQHRRRRKVARPDWVRPLRRAQRKLDSSASRLQGTLAAVVAFAANVERRPVRTCRRLTRGLRDLATVGVNLIRAERELAEARACLARVPEHAAGDAAEIIELATERWLAANYWLQFVLNEVAMRQLEVYGGLVLGELVPEHPSDSRPRIVVTPRPLQIRAFFASRQHRVADRITPVLRRRRHASRPAALIVPPPTCQGRAPPLSSTCAL